jgi:phytoene dehydrogenase-like protein
MANPENHYDVVIIGAGMAGLAAGIRLAHFGRRVCLLERHNAIGGLNSFYSIDGRKFDVGLHAMTNFVPPHVRGTALGKILRQLRLDRDALDLCPQLGSAVRFPGRELRFSNDPAVLEAEVAREFPAQIDRFRSLVAAVRAFDDLTLSPPPLGARAFLRQHLTDPTLEDMLLCPLLYYGSAQERDMEAVQFVIMFKAIFLEGLARPFLGIRPLLRLLADRFRACGGERRMKQGVRRLRVREGRVAAVELDSGATLTADLVFSSAGAVETLRLCDDQPGSVAEQEIGRLSFVETIQVLNRQPQDFGWDTTIVFFNDHDRFDYARPEEHQVDPRSGVICLPNNFDYGDRTLPEGVLRVTCLANYDRWHGLPEERYRADKAHWFREISARARRFLPPVSEPELAAATVATDMFTPTTVRRFTGHLGGAIYGAKTKIRDGRTPYANLFLCGTDQGFLGIVGAMLSGITMANIHGLKAGS